MQFTVDHTDSGARAGRLFTDHGVVETPVFMPIGTQGSVKAIGPRELREVGTQIILGNTYHLFLRPGVDVIHEAEGLHKFAAWSGPILTDSGGYQVFSLSDLKKISEEGVQFRSHLDGSLHVFAPESVVDIQRVLGADIMMVLDECVPYPCAFEDAQRAHERTLRWAERCKRRLQESDSLYDHSQALFGIVQGSVYAELRAASTRELVEMDFDGYAIGGLSVGELAEDMYAMTQVCTELMPAEKPRYLMGVGTPQNLLESIERGIDMFDCVLPTRNGRNAMMFTRTGNLSITNAVFRQDFGPIDAECECYVCRNFSRAYIRHLFQAKEILALQLATFHNLHFYHWLMREARTAIVHNVFTEWKREQLEQLSKAIQIPT